VRTCSNNNFTQEWLTSGVVGHQANGTQVPVLQLQAVASGGALLHGGGQAEAGSCQAGGGGGNHDL
jgi:hypothetical protein